ncbi:Protein kinase superfamily protein [Rhynchospora pubera]|uniref:Protein kinase superfamily protein n=1 Tax=Rhynchospora pubera TaxID=906938 RepID=A0AAV8ATH7_9POAL|nr:Protein kinase superfamily protein [Rhynchospora pubera]
MNSTGPIATPLRCLSDLYEERVHNFRVFDYKDLKDATKNFNRTLKLGEGGFGIVYKGILKGTNGNVDDDSVVVAVKRLKPNALQGHKQWLMEVQLLCIVNHPNLVKFIGYCAVDAERGPQRLLVYEFMPNKTLDHHLFNRDSPSLPWDVRLKIALGAAEGLLYLHQGLEIPVIYRDFKASNVLLDDEYKPKLSDFGLAREGPTFGNTHVSTAILGTNGYAAPDYIETGHLTTKSDVFSFGVVLYEIITGRRSLDRNRPKNEQKLLEWVKQYPVKTKQFKIIIDPRLQGRYQLQAARKIAKLADSCLAKQARDRPTMGEVVKALKRVIQQQLQQQVELSGEQKSGTLQEELMENNKQNIAELTVSESTKRRMMHLTKMTENAGGVLRRRRLLQMKVGTSPSHEERI